MYKIYEKDGCPYCVAAKNLLTELELAFETINLWRDFDAILELSEMSGMRTFPQIFKWEAVRENLIGGYTELKTLNDEWRLL